MKKQNHYMRWIQTQRRKRETHSHVHKIHLWYVKWNNTCFRALRISHSHSKLIRESLKYGRCWAFSDIMHQPAAHNSIGMFCLHNNVYEWFTLKIMMFHICFSSVFLNVQILNGFHQTLSIRNAIKMRICSMFIG